ncbi:ABC transporter substrate-binding protein [Streptomyces boninensis]|uniref:ABC transporter substrate-binding protein n=1 Tax=Streptomyces boninensis TaxID=2039455 RepID=UPI003B21E8E7
MPRLLRTAMLALVPLALVAGCNSASTAGKSGGEAASVRGVTDDSIKVGGIVSKTTTSGYSKADTDLGAKARFDRANAEGGVNGRKIDYLGAEDDGQDPAKNLAAARTLVQREKVFAISPMSSVTFSAAGFLKDQKVPVFGWGTIPSFCDQEYAYGYNGCLVPRPGHNIGLSWQDGLKHVMGGAKGKSVALVANDSDAGKFGIRTYKQGFAAAGFKVTYAKSTVPAAAAPSDWSGYIGEIMKSDGGKAPDAVVSVMQTPHNIGLFTALKRAGYKGVLTDPTDYDPGLLAKKTTRKALDGVYVFIQSEPFQSAKPAMKQFKADIKKAAGKDVPLNMHMMTGYLSADLFLAIAEKAGKELTTESFQAAADGFKDTGTMAGDREFPKGHEESFNCGSLVRLKGGAYEVASKFRCSDTVPFK